MKNVLQYGSLLLLFVTALVLVQRCGSEEDNGRGRGNGSGSGSDNDNDNVGDGASTSSTVAVGGSVRGTIDDAEDEDWFKVELMTKHAYRFDLEGADTNAGTLSNPGLRIYLPDGRSYQRAGGRSLNERVTFELPDDGGGPHFLAVFSENKGIGTYTLSVTELDE